MALCMALSVLPISARADALATCNIASTSVNGKTPITVDKSTILYSSRCSKSGNVVTLKYMFRLNFQVGTVSQAGLESLRPRMLNHWCTNPDTRPLIKIMDIEGIYSYSDGQYIGNLLLHGYECQ